MYKGRKVNPHTDMTTLHSYLWEQGLRVWSRASDIKAGVGLSAVAVRVVCQSYPALFVSSRHGYKLAAYATRAEIQDCVKVLLSRSVKIAARASALSGRLL